MKRSEINQLVRDASVCFEAHGWALPPNPRWDVTDFGLGDWRRYGLVLINLAEEPEYCEKLMYARKDMTTPAHTHHVKKEDIVCRWGRLQIRLWTHSDRPVEFKLDGEPKIGAEGGLLTLEAGQRVTLFPGIYHEFAPLTSECIIGEVSTVNDDVNDNVFLNADVGRYPQIEEDEPPIVRLLSDFS